jgi:hypothetical protein
MQTETPKGSKQIERIVGTDDWLLKEKVFNILILPSAMPTNPYWPHGYTTDMLKVADMVSRNHPEIFSLNGRSHL